MQEVERYWLDIVDLIPRTIWVLEPVFLRSVVTPFLAGVIPRQRQRAGVGLLIAPQFSVNVLWAI